MGRCKIEGCEGRYEGRGFCTTHYQRLMKHGNPLAEKPRAPRSPHGVPLAWLESHVRHEGGECLTWPFSRSGGGYGNVWLNKKVKLAHRVMCERAHGPPSTPIHDAAHSCGKGHEGCCNPKHLSWKTKKENQADRRLHGTASSRRKEPQARNQGRNPE